MSPLKQKSKSSSFRHPVLFAGLWMSLITVTALASPRRCNEPEEEEKTYETAQSHCDRVFGREEIPQKYRTACSLGVAQAFFTAGDDECNTDGTLENGNRYCDTLKDQNEATACKRGNVTYLRLLRGNKR